MRTRRSWIIAGVAAVCFVTAVALSHRIEPGVHVEKVALAKDTPALKFIPTGAGPHPVLGDHAPPLLLLAGRFEVVLPPALLQTRTEARLVISPWSDHLLEGFDPVLVNASVIH